MPIGSDPANDQRNVLAQALMGQGLGSIFQNAVPKAPAPNQSAQTAQPVQPGMVPGTVPSATPTPQLDPGLSMPPPQPPQQMMPQSLPPQASLMNPGVPQDFGAGAGGSSIGPKGAGANPPTPATMNAGM